ncbi:MAG: hypothetical protein GY863_14465 [bacterium]|nr:hypothetical protein [bacterium]
MTKKEVLFGDHLSEKGLLSDDCDYTANFVPKEGNKQVGELAVKQRLLAAERFQQIFQQVSNNSGKKSGEIIIDLKTTTQPQLKELRKCQKKFQSRFTDLFQVNCKIPVYQLDKEIKEFVRNNEQAAEKEKSTGDNG